MTLGLIPQILNPVNMVSTIFFINEMVAMIDSIMLESTHIQHIIA